MDLARGDVGVRGRVGGLTLGRVRLSRVVRAICVCFVYRGGGWIFVGDVSVDGAGAGAGGGRVLFMKNGG